MLMFSERRIRALAAGLESMGINIKALPFTVRYRAIRSLGPETLLRRLKNVGAVEETTHSLLHLSAKEKERVKFLADRSEFEGLIDKNPKSKAIERCQASLLYAGLSTIEWKDKGH